MLIFADGEDFMCCTKSLPGLTDQGVRTALLVSRLTLETYFLRKGLADDRSNRGIRSKRTGNFRGKVFVVRVHNLCFCCSCLHLPARCSSVGKWVHLHDSLDGKYSFAGCALMLDFVLALVVEPQGLLTSVGRLCTGLESVGSRD